MEPLNIQLLVTLDREVTIGRLDFGSIFGLVNNERIEGVKILAGTKFVKFHSEGTTCGSVMISGQQGEAYIVYFPANTLVNTVIVQDN